MAEKKAAEQKAAAGPAENKASEAPELTREQKAQQEALAQSGYRVPEHWHTDAARQAEKDAAVAKGMEDAAS